MCKDINYEHWSDEYEANAARIQFAIDKRKQKLRNCKLSADQKKILKNEIAVFQAIKCEQLDAATKIRNYIRRHDETAKTGTNAKY